MTQASEDRVVARARISYRRAGLLRTSAELERWREVAEAQKLNLKPPYRGWIRYIRDALHMNGFQLARRVGVRQPSIARLEQKEREETITLRALRRVAHALDCELVYALIPRRPLKDVMGEQVRRAAAVAMPLTSPAHEQLAAEELERELLVRMPTWIWGTWDHPELYGVAGTQEARRK
jgi:predicted DNA-binding mobile mystery protein A